MNNAVVPSSFRDPSGFLFRRNGIIYRQVNPNYKVNYDQLINSGLYKDLISDELLIPHKEVSIQYAMDSRAYKILRPELITFISYPYEWCFSQLQDAALTTLEIQKRSLNFGMSLKDCSAYNIQFRKGRPVLIDTLSFEQYHEGRPWVAYKQFCQHFLAPLALMSYRDIRLNQLLRIYIDGVPLDLASSLLPFHTHFLFPFVSHIHLHSRSQKHFANKAMHTSEHKISRFSFLGIIYSLESAIKILKWQARGTEWVDYYDSNFNNYSLEALEHKKQIIADFLDIITPECVWDLGGNVGLFSRISSNKGIRTISFDVDPAAVEKNYLDCRNNKENNILPLVSDLTNPSPAIGWLNQERLSLLERGPVDTVLALALIHHLAISNNLPFIKISEFLKSICNSLIIEFVPKTDSQVQVLLLTREDIFNEYTQVDFENCFKVHFKIQRSVKIIDSQRTLYLMKSR
jgi:ribosomal protein L11 methylase PrmA